MDDVTGAVVATVLFAISIPAFWVILFAAGTYIGAAVGDRFGRVWSGKRNGTVVGGAVGWALAVAWVAFALIQAILQIIRLIQLLT